MGSLLETPALSLLAGAYFHEDYLAENGGMWETVDAFLDGEPDVAPDLEDEITSLLATHSRDGDLADHLRHAGCRYDSSRYPGGTRAWLRDVAQRSANDTRRHL